MFLILILTHALSLNAAEPAKAKLCVACHGEKGISPNDLWPNIAGQKKAYMIKQIKAFRDSKKREDPLMTPISKQLTDKDIEELTTYYSKMKACP